MLIKYNLFLLIQINLKTKIFLKLLIKGLSRLVQNEYAHFYTSMLMCVYVSE